MVPVWVVPARVVPARVVPVRMVPTRVVPLRVEPPPSQPCVEPPPCVEPQGGAGEGGAGEFGADEGGADEGGELARVELERVGAAVCESGAHWNRGYVGIGRALESGACWNRARVGIGRELESGASWNRPARSSRAAVWRGAGSSGSGFGDRSAGGLRARAVRSAPAPARPLDRQADDGGGQAWCDNTSITRRPWSAWVRWTMRIAVGQIVCGFRVFVRRAARLSPQLDVRARVDDVHNVRAQGVDGRRLVE